MFESVDWTCRFSLFAAILITCSGLNCWVCDNAPSNDVCMEKGRLEKCHSNQVCQNEVRRNGQTIRVFKRCKQKLACENDFKQNSKKAWNPTQCNSKTPSSVCRCCCNFDKCNAPTLGCIENSVSKKRKNILRNHDFGEVNHFQSSCPITKSIRFGKKFCTVKLIDGNFGTECEFLCNPGYRLVGSSKSSCRVTEKSTKAKFDNPFPMCEPYKCRNDLPAFKYREVSCTNSFLSGSVCTFTCHPGYFLRGRSPRKCRISSKWSSALPVCIPTTCPEALRNLTKGSAICSNSNNLGSLCKFKCDQGYSLVGSSFSRCTIQHMNSYVGKWSHQNPKCEPIACALPTVSSNGSLKCNGSGKLGTVCNFNCSRGYFMVGESSSICMDDFDDDLEGTWNFLPPVCHYLHCQPIQSQLANGTIKCSNGAQEGSNCVFTCNRGFNLVGANTSICRRTDESHERNWSNLTPVCEPIQCSPQVSSTSTRKISCTNNNFLQSKCDFTCSPGLTMIGEKMTMCIISYTDQSDTALWTSEPPLCEKYIAVQCFAQPAPINGNMICSDLNNEDSVCAFTCDSGYNLEGVSFTLCQRVRSEGNLEAEGRWSTKAPTCRAIRCPVLTSPNKGRVYCDDENKVFSQCTFGCNNGYLLIGNKISKCNVNGKWSSDIPECARLTCGSLPRPSANSRRVCSDGYELGSRCEFICEGIRYRQGPQYSTCIEQNGKAFWNNKPPVCIAPSSCFPTLTSPSNGRYFCTSHNLADSICLFFCNEGYRLIGKSSLTCKLDGSWTSSPPICKSIKCGNLPLADRRGRKVCTDSNNIGSVCEYTCKENYELSGATHLECVEQNDGDLVWSADPPSCLPTGCDKVENLLNGDISCSNENKTDSTCAFECNKDKGFHLYPAYFNLRTCQKDGTWSHPMPCCIRNCPSDVAINMVIVLDSSASIGERNWPIMKGFVRQIIQNFTISPDLTQVAVFRYNRQIDKKSQIDLGKYSSSKHNLLGAVDKLPYDGKGTFTGQAITYAHENILNQQKKVRADVKDVVVIITASRSDDNVIKPATYLRTSGALTYAVGVEFSEGLLDMQQLTEIGGSPSNVHIVQNGIKNLKSFDEKLIQDICRNSCVDRVNKERKNQAKIDKILSLKKYIFRTTKIMNTQINSVKNLVNMYDFRHKEYKLTKR